MLAFNVILGDITQFPADAIVNAANTKLAGGGGVDGAIHRAAGPELHERCSQLGGCPTGEAKITPAFGIRSASYIVHTPGPRFAQGSAELCDAFLTSSYLNCLLLAEKNGCKSVAFPSISTGIYGFPLERAAAIVARLFFAYQKTETTLEKVTMVCFDNETAQAYQTAFAALGLS